MNTTVRKNESSDQTSYLTGQNVYIRHLCLFNWSEGSACTALWCCRQNVVFTNNFLSLLTQLLFS
jgi:hypothetical protein